MCQLILPYLKIKKGTNLKKYEFVPYGGAAENRTRVQTSYKIAFYMYSLYLVFDNIMTKNNPYIT